MLLKKADEVAAREQAAICGCRHLDGSVRSLKKGIGQTAWAPDRHVQFGHQPIGLSGIAPARSPRKMLSAEHGS